MKDLFKNNKFIIYSLVVVLAVVISTLLLCLDTNLVLDAEYTQPETLAEARVYLYKSIIVTLVMSLIYTTVLTVILLVRIFIQSEDIKNLNLEINKNTNKIAELESKVEKLNKPKTSKTKTILLEEN